jgi:threonine synthase
MWGFQASGAAPLVEGHSIDHPHTIATAIRIGKPARGDEALAAVDNSGGLIAAVTDEEIMAAYRLVATHAGLMCEPASAASVAGIVKRVAAGEDLSQRTVVAVLTGHGLKDPATALSLFAEMEPVPSTIASVVGRTAVGSA